MIKNKGYTLLFAVLVSSLVLSIGISILTISRKEFLLSSSARDSTSAIYAADSGLECALYHNDNGDKFSNNNPDLDNVVCAGHNYEPNEIDDLTTSGKRSFTFHMKLQGNSCAVVKVDKYAISLGGGPSFDYIKTSVESRGYNIGWDQLTHPKYDNCIVPSPRRVERVLYYDAFTDPIGGISIGYQGGGVNGYIDNDIQPLVPINCSGGCSGVYTFTPNDYGKVITFTVTSGNSISWGGDAASCGTQNTCEVSLIGQKNITFTFSP